MLYEQRREIRGREVPRQFVRGALPPANGVLFRDTGHEVLSGTANTGPSRQDSAAVTIRLGAVQLRDEVQEPAV